MTVVTELRRPMQNAGETDHAFRYGGCTESSRTDGLADWRTGGQADRLTGHSAGELVNGPGNANAATPLAFRL